MSYTEHCWHLRAATSVTEFHIQHTWLDYLLSWNIRITELLWPSGIRRYKMCSCEVTFCMCFIHFNGYITLHCMRMPWFRCSNMTWCKSSPLTSSLPCRILLKLQAVHQPTSHLSILIYTCRPVNWSTCFSCWRFPEQEAAPHSQCQINVPGYKVKFHHRLSLNLFVLIFPRKKWASLKDWGFSVNMI